MVEKVCRSGFPKFGDFTVSFVAVPQRSPRSATQMATSRDFEDQSIPSTSVSPRSSTRLCIRAVRELKTRRAER